MNKEVAIRELRKRRKRKVEFQVPRGEPRQGGGSPNIPIQNGHEESVPGFARLPFAEPVHSLWGEWSVQ